MDSVEEYARRLTKSEGEELDALSEWIKSIRRVLKSRFHHLSGKMRTIYPSVFKKHDNLVLALADEASNNIVFVCKNYYYGTGIYLYLWESHLYYLEQILQRMKFFKIIFLFFKILSTSLNIKISFNCPTFIGFLNCIKILTNKYTLLVPINALLSRYF
jgi:hypothetical protein